MSLGIGPMSPKRWRPLEQLGWGIGTVAGGLVFLCLWAFALVQHLIGKVVPVPVLPKS